VTPLVASAAVRAARCQVCGARRGAAYAFREIEGEVRKRPVGTPEHARPFAIIVVCSGEACALAALGRLAS
jgi:hypothetical protein